MRNAFLNFTSGEAQSPRYATRSKLARVHSGDQMDHSVCRLIGGGALTPAARRLGNLQ